MAASGARTQSRTRFRAIGAAVEPRAPRRRGERRANTEDASMSDFDRNVAAFPGAARTVAVDAGLRAHMIRVYNYMAGGVALTGVVAYFTNQFFGQALYGSPLMYVLIFAPLALVFFLSFRIDKPLGLDRARAVLRLCGPGRRLAVDHLPRLHRRLDHAGVLHLGRGVRRPLALGLHHAARSDRHGLVPDDGPDRHHHRVAGQHLPASRAGSTGSSR